MRENNIISKISGQLPLYKLAGSISLSRARNFQKKNDTLRKSVFILAICALPVLLVLSPLIWILVLLSRGRILGIGKRSSPFRTAVTDAYAEEVLEQNHQAADRLARVLPMDKQSAPHLLRCISARDDEEWLQHFRKWSKELDMPEPFLSDFEGERLFQIRFKQAAKVTDGPKISVIMPAYNAEPFIEAAIRSVQDQTWENWELLVVNDGSEDKTADIVERISKGDNRIKLLNTGGQVGPYVAKNYALLQASGEYVTGHDADDLATSDRLETQIAPLLNDPNLYATMAHGVRLTEQGQFAMPYKVDENSPSGTTKIVAITLMMRKKLLVEEFGFWDCVRYGADSELIERIKKVVPNGILELTQPVFLCLQSAGSLTGSSATGISMHRGLSPARLAYSKAFRQWHGGLTSGQAKLDVSSQKRVFPAPDNMLVARERIESLLTQST